MRKEQDLSLFFLLDQTNTHIVQFTSVFLGTTAEFVTHTTVLLGAEEKDETQR